MSNRARHGVIMKHTGFHRFTSKMAVLPIIGALALAGCEDTLTDTSLSAPSTDGNTSETIGADIIAPNAFSITENALWDGRPTFGGVWIAYPDIDQPERVRITNPDTGKTVIGALYKRERQFPGPKIELSADAATALGVLAGSPTNLTVVALRRREVEIEVEAPVVEGEAPVIVTEADGAPVRRPGSMVASASTTEGEDIAAAAAAAVASVASTAPQVALPETSSVTAAAANTTPEVSATALPVVDNTAIAPPLSAIATTQSYIQVATLQIQSRVATETAKLERAGLEVEVRKNETGGRTLYRIVVGPAGNPDELKIMMGLVQELGYKDAFKLK